MRRVRAIGNSRRRVCRAMACAAGWPLKHADLPDRVRTDQQEVGRRRVFPDRFRERFRRAPSSSSRTTDASTITRSSFTGVGHPFVVVRITLVAALLNCARPILGDG
jgi:hypothetical protein